MRSSIELTHQGRHLTIRASVIAGDWQVWFYENGNRIYLYAVLGYDEGEQIEPTLEQARRDLIAETIIVPTVRFWPEATEGKGKHSSVSTLTERVPGELNGRPPRGIGGEYG
jgi:hypothetical protein